MDQFFRIENFFFILKTSIKIYIKLKNKLIIIHK